ncbi:MAG: hypothetical protein IJR02_13755 [Bacteroidaceae bacterium]|nr:hypothetical protein [Bacteroidaceae bacterium]
MRKIYALVLSSLLVLPSALKAQTMTEENAVLDQLGYRLEKDVNFREGFVNGKAIVPGEDLQFGGDDDFKVNNNVMTKVTNEGLEFLSVHTMKDQMHLVPGTGLRSTGNERWIAIKDLREGQILTFDISNQDSTQFIVNSNACNSNTGWADTFVDPLIVEPISGSIHELQELAEEGSADTYRYFKVINAGTMYAKFNGKTPNVIYRFQIWSDKNDAEAVSSPALRIVGVNGDSRRLEFKAGESTFGSAVRTFYSLDGSDPVFLKDTDEIDHYDYVYGEDEEGNQVAIDSVAVYKRVLDTDLVAEVGTYGDYEYNPEDGYIDVYAAADEDGDGIVVVKAASVSELETVSNIVTINVPIGVIQLNGPTLSLSGISGLERIYTISWDNNTLCGEDYQFIVENSEGVYMELEPNTGIGETISSATSIKVTVKVEGYANGETTLDEVAAQGIDMKLKEAGNAQSEDHNWDFRNLTQEVLDMINENVIDHYAVYDDDGNEIRTYTVEQEANEEIPEEDQDKIVKVPLHFGWDGSDSRNAARHWRTWIPTYELDEEGNPTENVESSVYAEEETGLFKGLDVDNDHPKYSTMAIFTDQSGLYFMSRGTIVVKPVTYGEYVMVSTNTGTTVTQYLDPDADCTISIGNGVYVYAIDIFTYENLPEMPDAISSMTTSTQVNAYYTLNGVKVSAPQKGINIVKYADGSVKKLFVK